MAARRKKADFERLRRPTHGKLRLIAVSIRLIACKNRLRCDIEMPDPGERIRHLLLLKAAFGFICDMPPGASTALLKNGAVRLDPVGGRRYDLMNPRHSIILLLFDDMRYNLIALRRIGNEYGQALIVPDAAPLSRHASDGQGNPIVLLQLLRHENALHPSV